MVGAVVAVGAGTVTCVEYLNDLERRAEARALEDIDEKNTHLSIISTASTRNVSRMELIDALASLVSRGVDLSDVHLQEVDIAGSVLSRASMSRANFFGALMVAVDLSDADLTQSDLRHTSLIRADLSGAMLYRANFGGADLTDADLSNANLVDAHFHNANLYRADLEQANLAGTNFAGANLHEANVEEGQLALAANICRTVVPSRATSYRDCFNEAPDGHVEPLPPRENTD